MKSGRNSIVRFALVTLSATALVLTALWRVDIVRATQPFSGMLTGAQETPPNASPGTGFGTVVLSDDQTTITVNLSFSGLVANANGAHIHNAAPGVAGPIIFPLTGVPAATSGTIPQQSFAITAAQVAQLQSGLMYFNVHSATFPGGEIRGQILVTNCTPPPPGMVAWWPGEGNANDIRGENNGTLVGGATASATGEVERAFSFDGASATVVSVPDKPSLNVQQFSIDAWVFPTVVDGGNDIIVNKELSSPQYEISIRGSANPGGSIPLGNLAFFVGGISGLPNDQNGWVDGGGAVPLNTWTHIALTFDGSSASTYINGVLKRTVNGLSGNVTVTSGPFRIGSRDPGVFAGDPQAPFNGSLDEVELFSRALSQSEIQNIYFAGTAGKCRPRCVTPPTNLVSWWTGDGHGFDSQSTNALTLNGATFSSGKVGRAFSFNGSPTQFADAGRPANLVNPGNQVTLDGWINPTNTAEADYFGKSVSGANDYGLGCLFGPTCQLFGVINETFVFTGYNPPINTWTHVTLTYDGSTLKVYANGVQLGSTAVSGNVNDNSGQPFTIGGRSAGDHPFNGKIDEVEVFNRGLTAAEVQAINNAASAGKCKKCLAPPSGMAGWWNGDANPNDSSGNGNNGTLQGGAGFGIGKAGQGFNFNGSNQFVLIPNSASLQPQQLTADAWVFPRTVGDFNDAQGAVIFGKDAGSVGGAPISYGMFGPGNTGRFTAVVRFTDATQIILASTNSFSFNQWSHVAMTWDGSTLRLYVNGNLEGSTAVGPKTIVYTTDNAAIGRHSHVDRSFDGLIDEAEFFNRVLTQTEIQSIVAAGPSGKCKTGCVVPPANMVSWWPAAGDARDIQGGHNGTLRNGTTFANGKVGQAFSFDGINDSVDTSALPSGDFNFGASDLTVDAWVKFTTSPISPIIFATPQSQPLAQLRLFNNRAEFFIRDDGGNGIDVVGTTVLNDGAWHHLAGVRSGTTGRLYVDGAQENTATNASFGLITSTCGFAFIGGNNSGVNCGAPATENFFNGLIDEVEVFRRALSAAEILGIFNADSAGKCKINPFPPPPPLPPSNPVPIPERTFRAGDGTIAYFGNANPGTTRLQSLPLGQEGPLPFGFETEIVALDLVSTQPFTGGVRVCLNLQAINDPRMFNQVRVLHLEGNLLINRTSFAESATRTLCADVNSFSPLVVVQGNSLPTAANGSIGGTITDGSGAPVGGVTINLSGTELREAITDSAGHYSFDGVETNGFYTVTPSRANYTFSPASRSFSLLGVHTEASFTASANGNQANAIDTTEFFVRQHYLDFLLREPDPPGFIGWVNTLRNCAAGDTSCDRVHVSESFYRSQEFQERGYFAYRFYATALGRKPDYAEFVPDLARVSGFLTNDQLEAAKVALIDDFMTRPAFVRQYDSLSDTAFVDTLMRTAGVDLSNRQALIDALRTRRLRRAQVLRLIAESGEVYQKYYNQAFVVMEYFGYLHRDPDALYLDWIRALDANPADSRRMVDGFVNSAEYRNRFAQ